MATAALAEQTETATVVKPIPHTIHRVWFDMGAGPMPPARYAPMHEALAKYHPHWIVADWDRAACESLLRDQYPWFLETWHGYVEDIMRVDAIRYFILYTFGGVYVDHDITFARSIDPMVAPPRTTVLVTNERWPRHPHIMNRVLKRIGGRWPRAVNNFVMASIPGSPLMRAAMLGLVDSHKSAHNISNSATATLNMAGPGYLGRVVSAHRAQYGQHSIVVLPPCSFASAECAPCHMCMEGVCTEAGGAYGAHHFHGSWGIQSACTADVWRVVLVLLVVGAIVAAAVMMSVVLWRRRPSGKPTRGTHTLTRSLSTPL